MLHGKTLQKVGCYAHFQVCMETRVRPSLPAEEALPSQHGLSEQMEEAAQEWFSSGPHDKVNFEVNLMVAPGPLGRCPGTCIFACVGIQLFIFGEASTMCLLLPVCMSCMKCNWQCSNTCMDICSVC